MIKKTLLLTSLVFSLPALAAIQLDVTLTKGGEETQSVLVLENSEASASIEGENVAIGFQVVEATEEGADVRVIVAGADNEEIATPTVTIAWGEKAEVPCPELGATLAIVPSHVA